jgi:hypothetical protein
VLILQDKNNPPEGCFGKNKKDKMKTSILNGLTGLQKKAAGFIILAGLLMSFTPIHLPQAEVSAVTSPKKAGITWKQTLIDLGEIVQNKPVTIEFEFVNSGDSPVVITSVQASCGCTATDYPKTPIAPGEKTMVKAVFNAAAKGAFNKTITVITSAESTAQILSFKGKVI